MIAAGILEPEGMITSRIALAETPAEIERLAGGPRATTSRSWSRSA